MSVAAPVDPRARKQRLIVLGALWLVVLAALVAFRSVVLPFAGAALIAYLVAPLVDWISSRHVAGKAVPRWVAILTIYAAFFLLVYLFFIGLVPQLYRELARIGREALDFLNSLTPERIQEYARAAEGWLTDRGVPVALSHRSLEGDVPAGSGFSLSFDLQKFLEETAMSGSVLLRQNVAAIFTASRDLVTSVIAGVFMVFFILMVGAFFSIDARAVRSYAGTLIPPEFRDDVRALAGRIDRSLAGVVRGQVIICLINGALTFLGLVLFGVKFAFLLATIATLMSLIPIFGSILSSVPIVIIGLSQGWRTGLSALAWIIGIHALEAYFLNPKILGTAARIHPLVVAFSLIAGERTFGLVGALFAVPLAAILVAAFDFARMKAQAIGEPPSTASNGR